MRVNFAVALSAVAVRYSEMSLASLLDAQRHPQTAVVAAPFAHTGPTLRPPPAGRLVLPGFLPGRNVVPVFAALFSESTGGKLGVGRGVRNRKFG